MTKKKTNKKVAKKVTKKTAKKKVTKTVKKTTKKAVKKPAKKSVKGLVFEYAPAPESTVIVTIKKKYELFIGGKFVAPESGKYMTSTNPATAESLTRFAVGSVKDVDTAVKAARKAYQTSW